MGSCGGQVWGASPLCKVALPRNLTTLQVQHVVHYLFIYCFALLHTLQYITKFDSQKYFSCQ